MNTNSTRMLSLCRINKSRRTTSKNWSFNKVSKKGWEDDGEIDFIKQQNEKNEEEERIKNDQLAKDKLDQDRKNKNLEKFKKSSNGVKITTDTAPAKKQDTVTSFVNSKSEAVVNKFKKGAMGSSSIEIPAKIEVPAPAQTEAPIFKNTGSKVKIGDQDEQRFLAEKEEAKRKLELLNKEAELEKIEEDKAKEAAALEEKKKLDDKIQKSKARWAPKNMAPAENLPSSTPQNGNAQPAKVAKPAPTNKITQKKGKTSKASPAFQVTMSRWDDEEVKKVI